MQKRRRLLIQLLAIFLHFRYRKSEELRIEKEHEFQREQAQLEAERRKQEQEHELRMLAIMMGNATQTHNPSLNVSSVFYPQAYSPIQQNNRGVSYMQAPFQAPLQPPLQTPNDVIFQNEAERHTYFKL